ncbi:hypothetical protein [Pectinatus haikarae]|uniref:hypothetical protein n=1 Tax=Pectinatus haikarae TaxID=349096 RepID=UPI0018C79A34|nr:hypothetical protein [Pectinatus haikarae]
MINEQTWQELSNLHGMPIYFSISVDAARSETYEKIRLGGKWDVLIKNLSFLMMLRLKGEVKYIQLSFVIQKANYNELIDFLNLAVRLKVDAIELQRIGNWGTYTETEYFEMDVLNKENPCYKEAWKMVQNILRQKKITVINNVE